MTERLTQQEAGHHVEKKWEEVTLNGEPFLVMRDLVAPLIATDGSERMTVFTYDEYQHVESGTQIQVWKLGMDSPQHQPAIVRLDYGCPCMQVGSGFQLLGHECAQQRDLMFQTVADIGIGAIATIAEKTAAGNGHGSHVVIQQATIQHEAAQQGGPIPSMQQAFSEMGYYDDLRRHNWAASALAHSIGTDRLIIPTTSNPQKIGELQNAGLSVVDDVRVELVVPQSRQTKELVTRRRSQHYYGVTDHTQPGAYLVVGTSTPSYEKLTRESYQKIFTHQPARRPN